jgi:predicted transcriptional regulator
VTHQEAQTGDIEHVGSGPAGYDLPIKLAPKQRDETNAPWRIDLATQLTVAWLSNSQGRAWPQDIPAFLEKMYDALDSLVGRGSNLEKSKEYKRAVSVRKSLESKDHIISMIDGKPYRSLLRHIAAHGLTAEQYRARYGLKDDYPLVSESYSQVRRELAARQNFGGKVHRGSVRKRRSPPRHGQ